MQATEVLEIINNAVRFMTEDELRVYEAARSWKGKHTRRARNDGGQRDP